MEDIEKEEFKKCAQIHGGKVLCRWKNKRTCYTDELLYIYI